MKNPERTKQDAVDLLNAALEAVKDLKGHKIELYRLTAEEKIEAAIYLISSKDSDQR